jgi:hypothetical protein
MTHITLTREALIAMDPCDLPEHLRRFGDAESMDVRQAFKAGFTIGDVLWVAGEMGLRSDCVRVAIFAAKQVAHLNTDPRVQAAIDAAQTWVDNPSRDTAAAAAAAADAAAADADADADAAAAAAAAAYAARAAAARAAYAARAAAARAAYAAAYAIKQYMIELWS